MSSKCTAGQLISTLDSRQEAHLEAFILAQHFTLATDLLKRVSGETIRWQQIRTHVLHGCGCWGAESRLALNPEATLPSEATAKSDGSAWSLDEIAKQNAELDEKAQTIYALLYEQASKEPKDIKVAKDGWLATRAVNWPEPIAYFTGGRQWVLHATGLPVLEWKAIHEHLRRKRLVAQVGKGYGKGFLLFPQEAQIKVG